jgi:SAM-dependent methyltransferase
MSQSDVFFNGEGNNWYERNKHKELNPLVLDPIRRLDFKPRNVLEVGCGDGRYLAELKRHFGCEATGIDTSSQAIEAARQNYPGIDFWYSKAEDLLLFPFLPYDLILFGFCLYLVDRDRLFDIVNATDSLLNRKGYLAIHDFNGERPEVVPYKHKEGVYSYHMDYPMLWLANPAYTLVSKTPTGAETSMTILQKTGWKF